MNILTGISFTASLIPCFLLLWVTSWNDCMYPVSESTATHSPSIMASVPLKWALTASAISGKLGVRSSNLLEYILTESLPMWTCALIPSYLYSMAHSPPIFSTTSAIDGRRSASITLTGSPTVTLILEMPSIPSVARVSATRPKSQVTLNALSISGLLSLVA